MSDWTRDPTLVENERPTTSQWERRDTLPEASPVGRRRTQVELQPITDEMLDIAALDLLDELACYEAALDAQSAASIPPLAPPSSSRRTVEEGLTPVCLESTSVLGPNTQRIARPATLHEIPHCSIPHGAGTGFEREDS